MDQIISSSIISLISPDGSTEVDPVIESMSAVIIFSLPLDVFKITGSLEDFHSVSIENDFRNSPV